LLESGADPNLANEVIIALFATAIYLIHTWRWVRISSRLLHIRWGANIKLGFLEHILWVHISN
jgi:hypothetical protein